MACSLFFIYFGLLAKHGLAQFATCPGNTTADELTVGFNLSGKFAVVSGGDSGLGFAIAKALARRGAQIFIGAHNLTKGREAAKSIQDLTGSSVIALPVDFTSFASVRSFANQISTTLHILSAGAPELHFLFNIAGIGFDPQWKTIDGFDTMFQVDYLSHFLLTQLLLPLLRRGSPSRVISVSGGLENKACEIAGLPQNCLRDWSHLPPPVLSEKNLSNAAIAIFLKIQHAADLARREASAGIEAFSFEPGMALTPLTAKVNYTEMCTHMHQDPCPYTADEAVSVALYCALYKIRSGGYFSRSNGCREAEVGMNGFTEAMQPELYQRSVEWSGLAMQPQSILSV